MSYPLNIIELAEELEELRALAADAKENPEGVESEMIHEFDEDEQERLEQLEAFESYIGCDLTYAASNGYTFIDEDDFEDYAREFAEGIGAVGDDNQWPVYCIDWERAARELATDYSSVEFEGHTYYYREG